jgi:hypothetical protein
MAKDELLDLDGSIIEDSPESECIREDAIEDEEALTPQRPYVEGSNDKIGTQSKKRRQVALSHDDVKTRPTVVVRPRGEAIDLPPYKDQSGRWRTNSLFLETISSLARDSDGELVCQRYTPIFTLREFPYSVPPSSPYRDRYSENLIPSLRELYLTYNDPTEYKFALEVFRSTYHWKHLCGLKWFKPYVEEWRKTLSEKLRGIGIEQLVTIAQGSDPKFALAAGKWLAEGSFEPGKTKGRPTKQEVASELKKEVDIERIYLDDAARLGLELVKDSPILVDSDEDSSKTH